MDLIDPRFQVLRCIVSFKAERFLTPSTASLQNWMYQPPCAKAEGSELYRRIGRELVTKAIGRLRFMNSSDR